MLIFYQLYSAFQKNNISGPENALECILGMHILKIFQGRPQPSLSKWGNRLLYPPQYGRTEAPPGYSGYFH